MTDLPYRPNVGIALFNRQGHVLIAKRFANSGPEIITSGLEWQMPQGGIDEGEDLIACARRELWEETGVTSVEYLGQTPAWLSYDFPPYNGPPHRLTVFRGQRQKWVAFRFVGEESEIDVSGTRNGMKPEFNEWRWEALDRVSSLVIGFRRPVYEQVAREFRPFAAPV
ncbi:RNA pyrophosphohydrolase [Microvirga sp. 2YAF29]|uniref:RNA pyrophosphohydrolase n=1 Tax=Microvirga sp. 2YAF29 TaxID=3233031 RepID=UPI003F982355